MKKVVGKVVETDEYIMFRRLTGNRSVTALRVKKLVQSIKEHGYVGSPVVINEKSEVVDGQARIEACKQLHVPVPYTVKPGTGIIECQALNQYSTIWKLNDYIEMYAELGDVNYIHLLNLMKEFNKHGLGVRPISFATTGFVNSSDSIKKRMYVCADETYVMARKVLTTISTLMPFMKRASGRKDVYACALAVFAYHPRIDMSHFTKRLEQHQIDVISVGTITEALTILEDIYNIRCKNKVYITADYKRALESSNSWFFSRFTCNGGAA